MLHWLTLRHCVWTPPDTIWGWEGVPCTKNNSPPSGNKEYYTTALQHETLHSRTLCWFAYFVASCVCRRLVFLPSVEYRINVEVECYHSYNNCYVLKMRMVSLLSTHCRTHCLPDHILLAVLALQGSRDQLLKHSNCCSHNKTNNASTLAVSVFTVLQWLSAQVGPFITVVIFPRLRHGEQF